MKKVLILGAGEMQVPVIRKSRELGVFSVVADYDAQAPGFIYADEKLLISSLDVESLLQYSQKEGIDGVLTTSDYPVNVVATIAKELGLCAMDIKTAEICTNKYLQRVLFSQCGIHAPFFKLCECEEELNGLIDFPYIVKPIDSSASRGVFKVYDDKELHDAFRQALKFSRNAKVLIESFIEGREFSVETFTQDNVTNIIAVTEKSVIGEEYGAFVEDTHLEPADLTETEYMTICSEVRKAIEAIGLNNSPSHTEIKLNTKGAYIIEIACRLGGDYITSDLVPLSTGVDMLGNLIKISLGKKIDVTPCWHKCSCVQFLNTSNYQRCLDFVNTNSPAIIRYEKKVYADKIIQNSLDRLGYIILQTETRQEMCEILKRIK